MQEQEFTRKHIPHAPLHNPPTVTCSTTSEGWKDILLKSEGRKITWGPGYIPANVMPGMWNQVGNRELQNALKERNG